MLIANTELRIGGGLLEPGLPLPSDVRFPHHVLNAHLSRRSIVEADADTARRIRQRYLEDRRGSEERTLAKLTAHLEAEVASARREIEAAAEASRQAEAALATAVDRRRDEEKAARDKLAQLDAQLVRLAGGGVPEPMAEPEAVAPVVEVAAPLETAGPPVGAPEPVRWTKSALARKSKDDLVELAGDLGLSVSEENTKPELVEAILDAQKE